MYIYILILLVYKEYPKIHARFEFCAIYVVKCCQRKKKRQYDNLGLKMECFTKEQNVFLLLNNILKIRFSSYNLHFSNKIIFTKCETYFHLDGLVNQ